MPSGTRPKYANYGANAAQEAKGTCTTDRLPAIHPYADKPEGISIPVLNPTVLDCKSLDKIQDDL